MVRRVIWTIKADQVLTRILEFYIERNKSKKYSKKLNSEINTTILLLSKHPFIGKKTDFENIRIFVKGNFKIFYSVSLTEIIVYLIWDSRQNPEDLKL